MNSILMVTSCPLTFQTGLLYLHAAVCNIFAARDLVAHFSRVGTPITTGGGELAHTM
jgi:hypothetical protein